MFITLASIGNFFGLDTLLIVLAILFFFGGSKIPEAARGIRDSIREFRKAKNSDRPSSPLK